MNPGRAFLTFCLLLVVLGIGFVMGRLMVARTYAEAAPKLEKLPVSEPEVAAAQGEERSLFPGSVYVPAPAPPEEMQEQPAGEGETGQAEATAQTPPEGEAERSGAETDGAPALPEQEPEAPPASGLIAPPRPVEPQAPKSDRYVIQVGVFTLREGARQVAEELSQAGYPAQIEVSSTEEQALYRVITGRYHTEYAARKALAELEKEGFTGFLVRR